MKRQGLLLEGNLEDPPVVSVFLTALQTWQNKRNEPKRPDPLHGTAFDRAPTGKLSGTQSGQITAVKTALQFHEVCLKLGTEEYTSLDEWLLAMSRWMMNADYMFQDPRDAQKFADDRLKKIPDGFRPYNMTPNSFRTYLNALARAYPPPPYKYRSK
jgi:hypothetical protein